MAEQSKPKWLEEVEAILRERFREPELTRHVEQAEELTNLIPEIEMPTGDAGEVISIILKMASKELRPLAAVYASFQLGIAWERYQNANRA